jgi:hypothetical protein
MDKRARFPIYGRTCIYAMARIPQLINLSIKPTYVSKATSSFSSQNIFAIMMEMSNGNK